MDLNSLTQLVSLLLGIISLVGGFSLYLRSSAVKRYASERDFLHLKNNYDQMSRSMESLGKDLDEVKVTLAKIESLLILICDRK